MNIHHNSQYNSADQPQQPQPQTQQNVQSAAQQQQSFLRQQATLTPSSRIPSGYSANHYQINSVNPLREILKFHLQIHKSQSTANPYPKRNHQHSPKLNNGYQWHTKMLHCLPSSCITLTAHLQQTHSPNCFHSTQMAQYILISHISLITMSPCCPHTI